LIFGLIFRYMGEAFDKHYVGGRDYKEVHARLALLSALLAASIAITNERRPTMCEIGLTDLLEQ
jgi:hypothetical protein